MKTADRNTQTRILHESAYSKTELGFLRLLASVPAGQTALELGERQWGVAPARARAASAGSVLHRLRRLALAEVHTTPEKEKLWQITPNGLLVIKGKH